MKRAWCLGAALLMAGCGVRDLTNPADPQYDHTSSNYPSDPAVGATTATLLTSWAGSDRSPTWSPDGSRIAFVSNRFTGSPTSIATSIYIMDATGDASGLVRITTGTVDQQPTWSPDGSTIVFVRNGGIYRVSSGGGTVTMLVAQNSGATDPRYSPDGTRIAFRRNNQIHVMPAGGGAATQVTADGPVNAYPEWLDANTLLYTQNLNGDESVWKITVGDATSAVRLTPAEPGFFRYADMSPDGSALAFSSSSDVVYQDMSTGLHTIARMGVQPTTDSAAANIEFSPDGKKVLFVVLGSTPSSYDVYVADVPALRSNVDLTPPVVVETVTGTLGQNNWYTSDVTVAFAASDAESGIASTNGCDTTVINTDGSNIGVTCTATNGVGLQTTKTVSINRDATAPAIAFNGSLSYTVDQQVAITCSATDAASGVATSTCPEVASGPAWTFGPSNTWSASAADSAGNSTSANVTFTVSASTESLSELVSQFVEQESVANSLITKLRAGQINAFVNEVSAKVGKLLTEEQADLLILWASTLESVAAKGHR